MAERVERSTRIRRRIAVATLLAVAVSCAACGSVLDDATRPLGPPKDSTTVPGAASTTPSVPTTGATPIGGLWNPESLPSCTGLTDHTSPPEWLPDTIPPGMQIGGAGSELYTEPEPNDAPPVEATSYVLAEAGADGELISTFDLRRGGDGPTPSMYDSVTGDGALDTVRGVPGSIVHLINRGDSAGWIQAEWEEHGVNWAATAHTASMAPAATPLWTEADLAATLDALELSDTSVSDPTGRFVVLGQSPVRYSAQSRRTLIDLVATAVGDDTAPVGIQITPRPEGATGLSSLSAGGVGAGARLRQRDGRTVVSTATTAIVELPDGSIATANVNGSFDIDGQTVTPAWTEPTQDQLVDMLLSIVAVDPSDARLTEVPMPAPNGEAVCNGVG